jgi:hypothetical protein
MLENLAEYFYDPLVFWTAPLVLVALVAGWRRLRAWGLRRLSGMPPAMALEIRLSQEARANTERGYKVNRRSKI